MGCHFLLQEVFLTQGLDPRLLHWQAGSLPLGEILKIFGHFSLYDEPQSKIPTPFKSVPGSYSQQLKPDMWSEERKRRSATLVHSSHMVTTWFLQDGVGLAGLRDMGSRLVYLTLLASVPGPFLLSSHCSFMKLNFVFPRNIPCFNCKPGPLTPVLRTDAGRMLFWTTR